MEKGHRCSTQQVKAATGCQAVGKIQTVQPFPSTGILAVNIGAPLPVLNAEIGTTQHKAYSYILSSMKLDQLAAP